MLLEDNPEGHKSIGQVLEEAAKDKKFAVSDLPRDKNLGKLDKVTPGGCILYAHQEQKRKCRVGKVITVARTEQVFIAHRHFPLTDGRLRVKWIPAYLDAEGKEVSEPGAKPSTETVEARRILKLVKLDKHSVLNPGATRDLDIAGWILDEKTPEVLPQFLELFLAQDVQVPLEVRLEHFLKTKVEQGDKKLRWTLPADPVRRMVTQFVDFMEM